MARLLFYRRANFIDTLLPALCSLFIHTSFVLIAFSVLTLLVGRHEEHPACNNWLMRCWCSYLSGARCRLFACGPADATANPKPHHILPHLNPDWFYLSGTGLPRLSWKRGRQTGVVRSSSWPVNGFGATFVRASVTFLFKTVFVFDVGSCWALKSEFVHYLRPPYPL